jgi:N-terminal domain of NWD NACHT-NTPase
MGEKKYIVKEQVDKIISAITAAKEFITTAASLEPHAALAWAGVSVLLPVSLANNYTILTLPTKRAL